MGIKTEKKAQGYQVVQQYFIFNGNQVAYSCLCINTFPSFLLVGTQLAEKSSCSVQSLNLEEVSLKCMHQSHLTEVQEQWELFLVCRAVFLQGMQVTEVIGALGTRRTELLKRGTLVSSCLTSFLPPCSFSFGSVVGRAATSKESSPLALVFLGLTELGGWLWQSSDKRNTLLLKGTEFSSEKLTFC